MIAQKDPYIKSAYNQLQIISQDKQKRLEYEAREKAIRDYNQGIFEAEQRGEQRGEQRDEQRGREEGQKEGIERMCKLQNLLLQRRRYDDLDRSAKDPEFREKLLNEYGI